LISKAILEDCKKIRKEDKKNIFQQLEGLPMGAPTSSILSEIFYNI
jgi:hypothetical protein